MNLGVVVGDARKRIEPNWVTGKERVYRPIVKPPLPIVGIRMADPDLLGSDPT